MVPCGKKSERENEKGEKRINWKVFSDAEGGFIVEF
jgi:hypothetical protein